MDTVIELVSQDARSTIVRLTTETPQSSPPPAAFWHNAVPITDPRRGYLQQFDGERLAEWATRRRTSLRLLVRPGDYVFPGAPIALMTPAVEGAEAAIRGATALGRQRGSPADLEFAIRQMVEVAVRALSPGINDPHTAISVLDRLASALCEIAPVYLPSGVWLHDNWPVLVVPSIDYDGIVDTMFHMIRQSAAGSAAVLIRMIEVLTAVRTCEHDTGRGQTLQRHADLLLGDAERSISTPADFDDIRKRHADFMSVVTHPRRLGRSR
ncbi:MAG: DUF2254 domain-containing protein [Stellaceae bacterium]